MCAASHLQGNQPVCLEVCGEQICQQNQVPSPPPPSPSPPPPSPSPPPPSPSPPPPSPSPPPPSPPPPPPPPARTATDAEYAQIPLVFNKYIPGLNCLGNTGGASDSDNGDQCFTDPATAKTCCTYSFDTAVPKRPINFVAKFTGSIYAPDSATYTFTLASDDASRLVIDGAEVVSSQGIHPAYTVSGTVSLSAGWHTLRVDYLQGPPVGYSLVVKWASTGSVGSTPVLIPQANLRPY
ncbi:hypothetical protein ABPG77_001904 [Micractinium sp. CCAP 211/92]